MKSVVFLWAIWVGMALPLAAQDLQHQGVASAGVCARCHVSSSLEWGISKHSTIAGAARVPDCVGCHGASKPHVADEQNSVKPDRVPRGAAIAALCKECHRRGVSENHPRPYALDRLDITIYLRLRHLKCRKQP